MSAPGGTPLVNLPNLDPFRAAGLSRYILDQEARGVPWEVIRERLHRYHGMTYRQIDRYEVEMSRNRLETARVGRMGAGGKPRTTYLNRTTGTVGQVQWWFTVNVANDAGEQDWIVVGVRGGRDMTLAQATDAARTAGLATYEERRQRDEKSEYLPGRLDIAPQGAELLLIERLSS